MTDTPRRTIRIPDWIWIPAQQKAERLGVPISRVIRACLNQWAREDRHDS